ncbi:MAG: guanylate kinase [Bacteroidales bacterium]|nr:guanylate kinase [Bacteroidales bacterium]
MDAENRKVIIISSPSGGGKTTIMHHLMEHLPELEFSISACSRSPRQGEINGKDYYFLTEDEFKKNVAEGAFLEHEEVYAGKFYGTLKSEVQRIWSRGHYVIFDVDVVGGCRLKDYFKHRALSIFIKPPNIEVLRERLLLRQTETPEAIDVRVSRAEFELSYADKYDMIILNDSVEKAVEQTRKVVTQFLEK